MVQHLLLQKGNKTYLLLAGEKEYHIITADRRLSDEAEAWLLAQERSVPAMNERQLSRQTIERSDLRGISLSGSDAGSMVQFNLKDKKLRYELADDYTEEALDNFFTGIQRFRAPKINNSGEDWRVKHQEPEQMRKLRFVGGILNFTGCASGFVMLFAGLRFAWLNWLAVASAVAAFVLWLMFPYYFTVIERKKGSPEKKKVIEILLALIMPGMGCWLGVLKSIDVLDWAKPWIFGTAVTVLLTLVVWKHAKELHSLGRILGFAAACLVLSTGMLLGINQMADFRPVQTISTKIVELEVHESARHRDSYYVHVQLSDETIAELPVRASYFKTLQVGEWVEVEVHEGALDISYAAIAE